MVEKHQSGAAAGQDASFLCSVVMKMNVFAHYSSVPKTADDSRPKEKQKKKKPKLGFKTAIMEIIHLEGNVLFQESLKEHYTQRRWAPQDARNSQ